MNTFGQKIKVTVFGQSHADAIGVVIDGLEANKIIDTEKVQAFLDRRAPGKNKFSTARKEPDKVKWLSGLYNGKTCGAPLCAIIENCDAHSKDYSELEAKMRPSHADYPANVKFDGNFDVRGGGQFSGRMTAPICIAGGIDSYKKLDKVKEVAPWAFTVGSALFENRFNGTVSEQIDKVLNYINK